MRYSGYSIVSDGIEFPYNRNTVELVSFMRNFYKTNNKMPLKNKVNDMRRLRASLKCNQDSRLINYYCNGDYDWYNQLYVLAVNSEEEVWHFIRAHQLNDEYVECRPSMYDCTGQRFGGEPIIKKLCDGRYTLRYGWNYDL